MFTSRFYGGRDRQEDGEERMGRFQSPTVEVVLAGQEDAFNSWCRNDGSVQSYSYYSREQVVEKHVVGSVELSVHDQGQ